MKKTVWIIPVLLLATFMLYAGCKGKAGAGDVPLAVHAVTYSDEDSSGTVNQGDLLIVAFNRHVLVSASTPVENIFELSSGSLGIGPTKTQTSGHAITITLGNSADLSAYNDDVISDQLRVRSDIPATAVREEARPANSLPGGGTGTAIEGKLGYAAPRILSAVYDDYDGSGTITEGDLIEVTFTGQVTLDHTFYLPGRVFILPVTLDGFGSSAQISQSIPSTTVMITLGTSAKMAVTGTHTVGTYSADGPSGLDIAIKIEDGLLTFDAGGDEFSVPPGVVDIE